MTATAQRTVSRSAARVAWARRRPRLVAGLVYLVLALIMFAPALVPGHTLSGSDLSWFAPPWLASKPAALTHPANADLADPRSVMQPFAQYTKQRLPGIPLWNPYIQGGRPLLADGQAAVFSPFSLPAYILPFFPSLGWTAVMKLWVAAFGMFLLGRALGMRFAGGLLSGLVYGFNLWLVTWLSYPHSGVWALLPWVLLATEYLVRRPDLVSGGGLAAAVGVQFLCGHPESSFHVLVSAVGFFVLRVVQAWRRDGGPAVRLARSVLVFGASMLGGVALAALVLLPFAELVAHSSDIHARAGLSIDQHIAPKSLLEFFTYNYFGRATHTALAPFLFSRAFYAGALPLMLAPAAIMLRPKATRAWIAVAGIVVLFVVAGVPPFLQIVTRLPEFSSGHNDRLIIICIACLALLAGWGLDELCCEEIPRRRRAMLLAVSGLIVLVPFVVVAAGDGIPHLAVRRALDVAWGFAAPPRITDRSAGDVIHLASLIIWITVAGAGVILIGLRATRRLPTTLFATIAIALVAFDLLRAGMGYNPAIQTRYASQPATGAIRYLEARRSGRFVSIGLTSVPPNVLALHYGLYDAGGYDLPLIERYNRIWRRELSPEVPSQTATLQSPPLSLPNVDEGRLPTLRLLGVTDLVQATSDPILRLAGLRLAYNGADARVYQVEAADPRVFVVGAQETVAGENASLDAVTRPGFDPRRLAVTERHIAGVAATGNPAVGSGGTARIVSYEPERVVVDATALTGGLLVLGDTYFPGWKATVDGRTVPIARVDFTLRGVPLPAGRHIITFHYEPLSWRIGWLVSAVSVILLGVALVVGLRRRRRLGGSRHKQEPA